MNQNTMNILQPKSFFEYDVRFNDWYEDEGLIRTFNDRFTLYRLAQTFDFAGTMDELLCNKHDGACFVNFKDGKPIIIICFDSSRYSNIEASINVINKYMRNFGWFRVFFEYKDPAHDNFSYLFYEQKYDKKIVKSHQRFYYHMCSAAYFQKIMHTGLLPGKTTWTYGGCGERLLLFPRKLAVTKEIKELAYNFSNKSFKKASPNTYLVFKIDINNLGVNNLLFKDEDSMGGVFMLGGIGHEALKNVEIIQDYRYEEILNYYESKNKEIASGCKNAGEEAR